MLAEQRQCVVQLALDELGLRVAPRGEVARDLERARREVVTGDARRTEARQRQRVGADVALQVQDVETAEVTQSVGINAHNAGEMRRVRDERGEVVSLRTNVNRDAGLPIAEVG